MREKDKKNFIKVGLFTAALLLVFMIVVVSIGKEQSFFEKKTKLRTIVPDAGGLKEGSFVQLKGIKIGSVTSIDILAIDKIQISFSLAEKYHQWVKKDCLIAISNAGLVGDKYVEILRGSEAAGVAEWEDILKPDKSFVLQEWIDKGDSVITNINKTLEKIQLSLDSVNKDKKLSSVLENLDNTLKNMNGLTGELKQTSHSATTLINRFDKIASRVESGPGTLYSLIHDDELYENFVTLLGGANRSKLLKYFIRESIKRKNE